MSFKVRKATETDISKLLAFNEFRGIADSRSAEVKLKRGIDKYSILEDSKGAILGYSKANQIAPAIVKVSELKIQSNLKNRGLEKHLLKPLKDKYPTIIYNGGEIIRNTRNAVTINKERLKTRQEELDGVRYLVAPVVMVKEQVLNGELLPADEIAKSTPGWNGRPVVVYHPKDRSGNDTLANQPDVIPKYEVGKVFNAEYDEESTKLKGEVWIDISRARRKNADTKAALHMIQNSEELEVSTGYIVNDRFKEKGEFNGVEYNAIQRDILPDHLALLPDEIGACSWEDGAGVRNNSKKLFKPITDMVDRLRSNLSQKQSINQLVSKALEEEYDDFSWLADILHDSDTDVDYAIFNTREIWRDGELITGEKQYSISFSFEEDGSVLLGDTLVEVEPITTYITKNSSKEEKELNKKEIMVRDVIANSKGKLSRKDKSTLLNCNESALLMMLPESKRKAYATNAKPVTVNSIFGGRAIRINEDADILVEEIVSLTPEEIVATVQSVEDVAELEALVTAIDEAHAVLDEVAAIAEEEMGAIEEGDTDSGEAAANVDVSDIMEPDENPEEETVSALETASRKARFNKRTRTAKAANKKFMSVNDYINSIPDKEAREFIQNGIKEAKAHRATLLTALSSSKNCQFSEAELKKMETNQLEKIHAMTGDSRASRPATNGDYSARGIQANNRSVGSYIPLTANIFSKKEVK